MGTRWCFLVICVLIAACGGAGDGQASNGSDETLEVPTANTIRIDGTADNSDSDIRELFPGIGEYVLDDQARAILASDDFIAESLRTDTSRVASAGDWASPIDGSIIGRTIELLFLEPVDLPLDTYQGWVPFGEARQGAFNAQFADGGLPETADFEATGLQDVAAIIVFGSAENDEIFSITPIDSASLPASMRAEAWNLLNPDGDID